MKILWASDMDLRGSGYLNISIPLANGLAQRGHDVKVLGFGYKGDEHNWNLSIIPIQNFPDAMQISQHLYTAWKFDAMVVAMDIPMQEILLSQIQSKPFKYIGIMPIESDPLCFSWASVLMQMDKALIISEFGTNEAQKMGVTNARYIPIGIDLSTWRMPSTEERQKIRQSFGIEEDEFVVLTVADNQERKNLSAAFKMFAKFHRGKKARYILVTREHSHVGWRLRDLAQTLDINNQLMIFERGIGFKELWSIYAVADVFLLTSKAEGLSLPLLEAMAMGLICVGTNCTAIAEVLGQERGRLIDYDYVYIDPFGNGNRYFMDVDDGAMKLEHIYKNKSGVHSMIDRKMARYIKQRTWDKAINVLESALTETAKKDDTVLL